MDDHRHHNGGADNLVPLNTKLLKFPLENGESVRNIEFLDQGIHQNEYNSRVQIHDDKNLSHAGDQVFSYRVIPLEFRNGTKTQLLN